MSLEDLKKKNEAKAMERMIQTTEAGKAQYLAEKVAKVQPFLNENGTIAQIQASALNAVILAELQHSGVPKLEQQQEVFERCLAMADLISNAQLKRKWEGFRDCLKDQGETEVPPHLVWAAAKCGVEIVPTETPRLLVVDPAKMLVEH